jgi:class 3 adenylate cyclase
MAPTVSSEERAERRQVTVMFGDLVGSSALSAHMDPEDLREVISAYQKCVAETVQRFGGVIPERESLGRISRPALGPLPEVLVP